LAQSLDVAHDAIGPAQRLNRVRSKPGQSDSLTYLWGPAKPTLPWALTRPASLSGGCPTSL